jgi:hypothetical protein
MMKRHPIVIYDSYAWTGLSRLGFNPGSGYTSYFNSWFSFYDDPKTQKELNESLRALPTSQTAQKLLNDRKISPSELGATIETDWFRNRVTDICLWHEGEKRKPSS